MSHSEVVKVGIMTKQSLCICPLVSIPPNTSSPVIVSKSHFIISLCFSSPLARSSSLSTFTSEVEGESFCMHTAMSLSFWDDLLLNKGSTPSD